MGGRGYFFNVPLHCLHLAQNADNVGLWQLIESSPADIGDLRFSVENGWKGIPKRVVKSTGILPKMAQKFRLRIYRFIMNYPDILGMLENG